MAGAVTIARRDLDTLMTHARTQAPEEACALLLGAGDEAGAAIIAVTPTDNVAEGDRRLMFEVDPAALFAAHRAARAGGPPIVGVFHSHPQGPAEPSARDAEAAVDPDYVWIVAAPDENGLWQAQAFAARIEAPGGPARFEALSLIAV